MSDLLAAFLGVAAFAAILATVAIWAPRRPAVRMIAIGVTAALIPAAYMVTVTLLGQPKPATMEWAKRNVPSATVVGAQLEEGKAIYLWLRLPGTEAPRGYQLPWNRKLAEKLMKARRRARQTGGQVKIRRPFGRRNVASGKRVYVHKAPPVVPKRMEHNPAMVFQHPNGK